MSLQRKSPADHPLAKHLCGEYRWKPSVRESWFAIDTAGGLWIRTWRPRYVQSLRFLHSEGAKSWFNLRK